MPESRIFTKQAISIDDQLALLRDRGLIIGDEAKTRSCLTHIGYYRLSAYELPFQRGDHTDEHHQFLPGTHFDQIIDLYTFDRKLRLLVMDAIERIEIAIKSVIINEMCIPYGPHWYMDRTHFVADFSYGEFIKSVHKDIDHGKDTENVRNISIRHYYETYDSPTMPPLWMVLEALTFGTVSVIYSWIPFADQKRIADQFGLGVPVLRSWLHTASYTRNLCAHHARLWNRVYTKTPMIMNKLKAEMTPNTKFYAQAVMMQVFLRKISPDSQWAKRLKDLMDEYPNIPKDRMGFPPNWKTQAIWN
ncbi:MAG: Abi family protein [Pseudobdellovibrionaceae bacterium]|jgi:abortive infection bacteriophage resistance protein|nr:Abi family protein [Pseudobdellovibrionaceae bacterium]